MNKTLSYINIIFCLLSTLISATLMARPVFSQSFETQEPLHCQYSYAEGEIPSYSYEYLGSKKNQIMKPGELSQVTLYIKNTGTTPLFSDRSGCLFRPVTRLGTSKTYDHESVLHTTIYESDSGWQSPNRIKLDQKRLSPGEKGSFTFWMKIPETDNTDEKSIYREYFDVVVEGKQWLGNDFPVNFDVGEFAIENREYLEYVQESRKVLHDELKGAKMIEVDISAQRMHLKVGDIVIRTFPVSTGKWSTPTPYGTTQVYQKQEVRVSAAWPHYIMPKWMNFRAGGYGIHALPSIRYGNGSYWREALNHIGTRRSHGCIRLLPTDAEYAYEWAPVGTTVWVHG